MADQVEAVPKFESTENKMPDIYANKEEQTYFQSPLIGSTFYPPYNPDDLYQKTNDYSNYEDMIKDDQVSVCLQLKKDLILGSGFDIMPGDEMQEDIVEDIEQALCEDTDVPFLEQIEEILSAYEYGFSLTEKIFKNRTDGSLTLAKLCTRNPGSWLIHTDKKGSVEKYEQHTIDGPIEIDPKSLIHFVNNRKFQNAYGVSDLRAAYAAWFAKRQVIKYYAIFLEKAASPIPVAKYDKAAPQSAVNKIFEVIKRFQTKTAIAIPKDLEIEFLEAKSSGEAYHKAINLFNMFIGRALFIPDLIGLQGSETGGGAYALGKEQIGIFFQHISRRRSAIERIINKEIIQPIVFYNWGFVEHPPKFKFKPLSESDAIEFAKLWLEAVKGKAFSPNPEEINHFRKLVKFPEGEVEDAAQPQLPGQSMQGPQEQMQPIDENLKQDNQEKPQETAQQDQTDDSEKEPVDAEEKKSFGKIYKMPPGDYCKKVNFKNLETKLNAFDKSTLEALRPIKRKIMQDLYDQMDKKKILQAQKPERIDDLKLKYLKEMKTVLKDSFRQLYDESAIVAAEEIVKGNYAKKPLNTQQFLDLLEQDVYSFIGDWAYNVTKQARVELMSALKDGKPLSSVIDKLDEYSDDQSEVSLERYARTKHTEIMNRARHDFFEDSGVIAAYQYSAIMDSVTSDICAGLDGKIFEKGDEPIPPLHFNCRSTLIPITKYEDYKADEDGGGRVQLAGGGTRNIPKMPIDKFIEENKGDGFATKASTKVEPKKIDDANVEFETILKDEKTEVVVYSHDGKPFKETTIVYADDKKEKILKLTHKVLNG